MGMDDYGNVYNTFAAYFHPFRPMMMATKRAYEFLARYRHFYADLH